MEPLKRITAKWATPWICYIIIALIFLGYDHPAHAKNKVFIREYTYHANEIDSKATSRTIALEQIKRQLLEELGTYLESETEIKNDELSRIRYLS